MNDSRTLAELLFLLLVPDYVCISMGGCNTARPDSDREVQR